MSVAAIIVAILVFGVIVLIHEAGHFYAARRCGVKVEEFAIGMGPKLLSFQPGETVYSLRLFPIGGSCRMLGEDASTEEYEAYDTKESSRAFNNKAVWQRIIIILAGVFMNFVLALLVAVIAILADAKAFSLPVVGEVTPNTPAVEIGLQPGDRIVSLNGTGVHIFNDLDFTLFEADGSAMPVTIQRGTEKIQTTVTPYLYTDETGNQSYKIGFKPETRSSPLMPAIDGVQQANVFECLETAFFQNVFYVRTTFVGLFRLITLQLSPDDLSGPVGVVSVVGDVYDRAVEVSVNTAVIAMLNFTAILSVNIGIFNLLPLPALDGGRFMFLVVEGIRKKPVKPETEGMIHFVGFALLMILAVFVAYNDILKLVK